MIHTYSGYENKVKANLEHRIESMGMEDKIFQVLVPTEDEIEINQGQRHTVQKKVYPGYVLVEMILDPDSWFVVRNTPGVTASSAAPTSRASERAVPLDERSQADPAADGRRAAEGKVGFTKGQSVRVTDGPFTEFIGTVDEVNPERTRSRSWSSSSAARRPSSWTSSRSRSSRKEPKHPVAKKIRIVLTLQLPAGKATPAPPVGTALGPHGINIVEFTKAYNEKTADKAGQIIPAQITVFEDRSFTFILKTPPAADLLRKAAGIDKGSGDRRRETVGRVTRDQVREIAEIKMADLNANDIEAAATMIEGTARSMGIEVVG